MAETITPSSKVFKIFGKEIECTRNISVYDSLLQKYSEKVVDNVCEKLTTGITQHIWDKWEGSTVYVSYFTTTAEVVLKKQGILTSSVKSRLTTKTKPIFNKICDYVSKIHKEYDYQRAQLYEEMQGVNVSLQAEAESKIVGGPQLIIGTPLDHFMCGIGNMIDLAQQTDKAYSEATEKRNETERILAKRNDNRYRAVLSYYCDEIRDSIEEYSSFIFDFLCNELNKNGIINCNVARKYNKKSSIEISNGLLSFTESKAPQMAEALKLYPYNLDLIKNIYRYNSGSPALAEMVEYMGATSVIDEGTLLYHQDKLDSLGYPKKLEQMNYAQAIDFIYSIDQLDETDIKCLVTPVTKRISKQMERLLSVKARIFRRVPDEKMESIATEVVDELLPPEVFAKYAKAGVPVYQDLEESVCRTSLIRILVKEIKDKKELEQVAFDDRIEQDYKIYQSSFSTGLINELTDIFRLDNSPQGELDVAQKRYLDWRKKKIAQLEASENEHAESKVISYKKDFNSGKLLSSSNVQKNNSESRVDTENKEKREAERKEKERIAKENEEKRKAERKEKERIAKENEEKREAERKEKERKKQEREQRLKKVCAILKKVLLIISGTLLLTTVVAEIIYSCVAQADILANIMIGLFMFAGLSIIQFLLALRFLSKLINKLPRIVSLVFSYIIGFISLIMAIAGGSNVAIQLACIFSLLMCIAIIVVLTIAKKRIVASDNEDKDSQ